MLKSYILLHRWYTDTHTIPPVVHRIADTHVIAVDKSISSDVEKQIGTPKVIKRWRLVDETGVEIESVCDCFRLCIWEISFRTTICYFIACLQELGIVITCIHWLVDINFGSFHPTVGIRSFKSPWLDTCWCIVARMRWITRQFIRLKCNLYIYIYMNVYIKKWNGHKNKVDEDEIKHPNIDKEKNWFLIYDCLTYKRRERQHGPVIIGPRAESRSQYHLSIYSIHGTPIQRHSRKFKCYIWSKSHLWHPLERRACVSRMATKLYQTMHARLFTQHATLSQTRVYAQDWKRR